MLNSIQKYTRFFAIVKVAAFYVNGAALSFIKKFLFWPKKHVGLKNPKKPMK